VSNLKHAIGVQGEGAACVPTVLCIMSHLQQQPKSRHQGSKLRRGSFQDNKSCMYSNTPGMLASHARCRCIGCVYTHASDVSLRTSVLQVLPESHALRGHYRRQACWTNTTAFAPTHRLLRHHTTNVCDESDESAMPCLQT
jgi:hypothetical protein